MRRNDAGNSHHRYIEKGTTMRTQKIIDAITQEFGGNDLSVNVHPDGMQSIHLPRSDSYLTAVCPHALWRTVRSFVRRDYRNTVSRTSVEGDKQ